MSAVVRTAKRLLAQIEDSILGDVIALISLLVLMQAGFVAIIVFGSAAP